MRPARAFSIESVFNDCQLVCESNGTQGSRSVDACIRSHRRLRTKRRELPGATSGASATPQVAGLQAICNDQPPNPAGSSDECNAAKDQSNDCTVIETNRAKSPDNEQGCATGTKLDNESLSVDVPSVVSDRTPRALAALFGSVFAREHTKCYELGYVVAISIGRLQRPEWNCSWTGGRSACVANSQPRGSYLSKLPSGPTASEILRLPLRPAATSTPQTHRRIMVEKE